MAEKSKGFTGIPPNGNGGVPVGPAEDPSGLELLLSSERKKIEKDKVTQYNNNKIFNPKQQQ
jgi:hypothetical protein